MNERPTILHFMSNPNNNRCLFCEGGKRWADRVQIPRKSPAKFLQIFHNNKKSPEPGGKIGSCAAAIPLPSLYHFSLNPLPVSSFCSFVFGFCAKQTAKRSTMRKARTLKKHVPQFQEKLSRAWNVKATWQGQGQGPRGHVKSKSNNKTQKGHSRLANRAKISETNSKDRSATPSRRQRRQSSLLFQCVLVPAAVSICLATFWWVW